MAPSKTGVSKRTKKPTHRHRHSPEPRLIIEYVPEKSISSPKEVYVSKAKRIRKRQLNRKGVVIREIPAPVSPASKKRRAHDMVKKIKKKQNKLQDPLDAVVVEIDFEDDGDQSLIRNDNVGFDSPQ